MKGLVGAMLMLVAFVGDALGADHILVSVVLGFAFAYLILGLLLSDDG